MKSFMRGRPSTASLSVFAAALMMFGAVGGFSVYPAWTRAEVRAVESGRLLSRASQFDTLTRERDAVRAVVESARVASRQVLRNIPSEADQGALMRMLAIGAGPDVGTQTIVAGDVVPAMPSASGYSAVPVTVEMTASFARVMEILARAEGDRKLVRPIRIEISRVADQAPNAKSSSPAGFVEARIELDAVYGSASAPIGDAATEEP